MTIDEERARLSAWQHNVELRLSIQDDRLGRLDTVPATLEGINRQLWEMGITSKELNKKMDDNTKVTESVRDALTTGRVLTTIGKWSVGLAVGLSSIWAFFKGFK